jgi:hypothetical protein
MGAVLRSVAVLLAAFGLSGCALRLDVKPDRLALEPPPARAAGAVGLVAAPEVPDAPPDASPVPPVTAPLAEPVPGSTSARAYLLVDGGWTGQVNQESSGVVQLSAGWLVEPRAFSLGLFGQLGMRGEWTAWSVAVAGGPRFATGPGSQGVLLGEAGLSAIRRAGSTEGFLSSSDVSSGDTTFPYLGARLLLGLREYGAEAVFGLFVQQTLGTQRVTFQERNCSLFGCSTTQHTARDGGLSVGITFGYSGPHRLRPSPPEPAPAP